jgi:hypothetical protein
MTLVRITGTNFVRDINSMAIQPTDNIEKNEYLAKLRMVKIQKEEINTIKEEINGIKSDVIEIKDLLRQLASKV